jgi:hypothetical protein
MAVVLLVTSFIVAGCDADSGDETANVTAALSIRDGTAGDNKVELVLSEGTWSTNLGGSSFFTFTPAEGQSGRPGTTTTN